MWMKRWQLDNLFWQLFNLIISPGYGYNVKTNVCPVATHHFLCWPRNYKITPDIPKPGLNPNFIWWRKSWETPIIIADLKLTHLLLQYEQKYLDVGFSALEASVGAPKRVTALFHIMYRFWEKGSWKCTTYYNAFPFFFLWRGERKRHLPSDMGCNNSSPRSLTLVRGRSEKWERTLQSISLPMAKNPVAFSVTVLSFCTYCL